MSTVRVLEVVKSRMWLHEAEDDCAAQLKIHIHDAIRLVGRAVRARVLSSSRNGTEVGPWA